MESSAPWMSHGIPLLTQAVLYMYLPLNCIRNVSKQYNTALVLVLVVCDTADSQSEFSNIPKVRPR